MKQYDKLIFELSREGRRGYSLPENSHSEYTLDALPEWARRTDTPMLPEVSEFDVVRHFTNLSNKNFGLDTGFYPLGSCTMKYNPKINEEMASLPGFTGLHPLQPAASVQGALQLYYNLGVSLAKLTGLSEFTINPFAGAHGELTGLMIMRQYHLKRGDTRRTKVIVPDSAHGTNPASAAVCGLEIVEVKSTARGTIDVADLRPLLDDTIAGIMMTNPNTLGLFESEIPEIARLVHECGGLLYYDGANLNPMLGRCRPGDMGFDIMHINLHKTFSTPHGGGGPGAGPVGVREGLNAYLPGPHVHRNDDGTFAVDFGEDSIGSVSGFLGNFGVMVRAYTYILSLGRENVKNVGPMATLNANYIKEQLKDCYELPIEGVCKHEFVFDGLKDKSTGVTTLDVAKRLLDYGYHAPTIYFPLLFHQAIMIEPTETESKETLDDFIAIMRKVAEEAISDPEMVKSAPHTTPVRRLDETTAARKPILTYRDLINNK
ncbi:MAG: aminomethyl-transferring glycine dehydrogenase subunit GcvPB [Bacteroidales bacterium]|nr:aminomethyl-transferring glycine dehydrogenase subunit GcvPB [Bacteroidales bacterium]MDD6132683.1 aminomethyl-transferring glycine dehydrogenase subunit GcvPB [Bacteroidales bacterium]MDD6850741.1 aminomethyl-transferring glycine dehydrogenase subunit GcvPB [Bacteroidales bacterium]MDY5120015.1 aminomethyl-transferring glycine dehydrogenase subunit GcvPB [Muribaculaceae bacterium]